MGKLESRNIAKYFTHDGKPLKTLDGIDPVSYTHLTLPTKA